MIFEKTKSTPTVVLDKSKGIFEISGKSLPEDAMEFYLPIVEWSQSYLQNPNTTTILVFEYLSSASSKVFISIF